MTEPQTPEPQTPEPQTPEPLPAGLEPTPADAVPVDADADAVAVGVGSGTAGAGVTDDAVAVRDGDASGADQRPVDRSPRPAVVASDHVWRRGLASLLRPRFTAASAVIALLIGILGFALIAQVKSNSSTSTLSSDRPDDLVRILSDLDSRKDRLNTDIASLQETQRQLNSGAQSKQAALIAASQRADELGILAGTLPAEGPGIVIEMSSSTKPIDAIVVLDTVEELRGAGAEAMEISGANGSTVRIIASTWFVDGGNGGILASGTQLTGSLTITVIGDAQTMQTALTIPGGVNDTVKGAGGTVTVQQPGTVHVTALAPTTTLKYAHPVS